MDRIIKQMLKDDEVQTTDDKQNSVKEVVQEIVLCGLSRGGFFKTAAFYGGTAFRIFHGLDRFSEGLDFSLKTSDHTFEFTKYLPILEKEIIKIKFEVDTNPPAYANFENKYRLLPIPYEVVIYDMPSLFAEKIHAVIGRAWKNRVKGRELYDYIFYLSKGTRVNLAHATARLVPCDHISEKNQLTLADFKKLLCDRFADIDYTLAKEDLMPLLYMLFDFSGCGWLTNAKFFGNSNSAFVFSVSLFNLLLFTEF